MSTHAETQAVRNYNKLEAMASYDKLNQRYGKNKELPKGFELQALIALQHYPELKDTRIRFIVTDVGIPLSSRPHWASMLRSAKKRQYLVVIDNKRENSRQALLLKNQPFNAQVGIIGHELSHTAYYLNSSFFQILADAACQLSACRIGFERATDKRLINYGLGWQRYDHARFVRSRLSPNPENAANSVSGSGAYMSPSELLALMQKNSMYQLEASQTD
jgi:hypothetical protein